ncbi:MAG: hypothetical protein ISR47_00705 [Rhodospirillales bacterium]|nr:hypothetical protein [Rhodospirillales bacterium]
MDRIDLLLRLNLEDDIIAVIGKCGQKTGSDSCVYQIQEFIGSIDPPEEVIELFHKIKVVMELEEIADTCQSVPDQFCPAQLVISNILQKTRQSQAD